MGKKTNVDGGKKRETLELCNLWIYQCPSVCMTWWVILTLQKCPSLFSGTALAQRIKSHHFAITDVLQQLQNLCVRKQTFTDLCAPPAQPFESPCCEWQGPCWPERQQAAICKLAAPGCSQPVANQQDNCQAAGWGWGHCRHVMKVVYPLIISSKSTHEITAGFYRKSL